MGRGPTFEREPVPAAEHAGQVMQSDQMPATAGFQPAQDSLAGPDRMPGQDRMPARAGDAGGMAAQRTGAGAAGGNGAGAGPGMGFEREFSRVPVTGGASTAPAKKDAKKRSERGGFLQSVGSFLGALFSSPGAAIKRLFGSEGYGDADLRAYLERLDKLNDIEGNYDSDNKARAVVARWKAGNLKFDLTAKQKMLLIREMQSGATLDDDERAILELLKRSENGDLRVIFAGIAVDDLRSDFDGSEAKQLDAWLESRFEGGTAALRKDEVKPQGALPKDAPLFPYDWAHFRLKFEGDYTGTEIIEELARHPLAEREQAAKDLGRERTLLNGQIKELLQKKLKAKDKAAQDGFDAEMKVLRRKMLRMDVVMEEAFKDVVLSESPATLEGKTMVLTADQKKAAKAALKPEVHTSGGVPLAFQPKIPGETETYEEKLRALMPGMIDDYWNDMAKDRQPSDHSDATKMHTLKEMEDLAGVSKGETDTVFDGYYNKSAHPAMKADQPGHRASLHDLWQDTQDTLKDPSTKLKDKRAMARALVFYFFQSNDDFVAPLNRAHNASPSFDKHDNPLNAEAKSQSKVATEFTTTAAQVRKLNEIDRGWDASANPKTHDVNIQLFKPKGGVAEDQDFMWDMFQTLIHEYLHTLAHPKYQHFAESFGGSSPENNTLVEGMDSFLDEVVWSNVQPHVNDQNLREKVEGKAYAKLPPIQVRPALRRRYASYTEAVRLVNIVGYRNVVVAYFKGEVDKIGG